MFVICALCGLPGSGKTMLCQKLLQNNSQDVAYVHCCYDNYMPYVEINQSSNFIPWKENRRNILNQIETIILSKTNREVLQKLDPRFQSLLTEVNNCEADVIAMLIDDNMFYRGMRKEYYNLCCELGIGFCTIYLQCPYELCSDRNSKRFNPIPQDTIYKMAKQIEPPGNENSKWESYFITLFSEKLLPHEKETILQVKDLIDKAVQSPPTKPVISAEAELSKQEIVKSFTHQLDLILRKYFHTSMSDAKMKLGQAELQKHFQKLNLQKKNLFNLVESGYINELDYVNESGDIIFELLQEKVFTTMKIFM